MASLKQLKTEDLGRTYRKMLTFDYKKAEDNTTDPDVAGKVDGFAAGLLNIDKGEDLIFPGFFAGVDKDEVVVAYQHDITSILGHPLVMEERTAPDYGLWTESEIVSTTLGMDVMKLIRKKILKKMSIGYRLKQGGYAMLNRDSLQGTLKDFDHNGEGIPLSKQDEIMGEFDRRKLEAVFGLFKGDLKEYSIVTFPMNDRAAITGAKAEDAESYLDGLPFSMHPALVLATNRSYVSRAKALFEEHRRPEKKALNEAHREALEIIAAEGGAIAKEAQELLAAMSLLLPPAMTKEQEDELVRQGLSTMAVADTVLSGNLTQH